MKALGIIPARGGSKGVPGKNIATLCGKPLVQYTAEAALAAKRLSRLILSTDDEEIAEVGRECGLEVPFLRPAELAQDETPTLPVIQHAVRWVEVQDERYDLICILQPTNPLRQAEDIDGCIDLLEASQADAVVTVLPVPVEYNPHWVYFQNDAGWLRLSTGESKPCPRRQDLPPAFHREGSVYAMRRDVLMNQDSLYGKNVIGYLMDARRCVNIDGPEDWRVAEQMLTNNGYEIV